MTIFRAPLANNKGEVMLSMQAAGVVPAGAVPFRGLWVTINGLVCATDDTGQARKYVGGFALEDPSGLLLVTEAAPVNVPMDGINANVAGAVVTKTGAASLIHQGVAMTVSAPGGPLVVNKDEPPLTFYAGLEYGVDSAAIEATQVRDSEALYRDVDRALKVAAEDIIRQEFQDGQPLGTLMEAASTNKCQNWNANPDAALTNLVFTGDAAAISGRALDEGALVAAGLDRICTSKYVIKIDNSAGTEAAFCRFIGETGNTDTHIGSAYVRVDQGEGILEVQGGSQGQVNFTNTEYQRVNFVATPNLSTRELLLRAQVGAVVYCILNQWEAQQVVTSPIVTEGQAASRSMDQLSWSLLDGQGRNILNQAEGMSACLVRYRFSDSDIPNGTARSKRILRLGSGGASLLNYTRNAAGENRFDMFDGTSTVAVTITGGLLKDTDYLVCSRWNQGANEKQIGFKANGTWTWSGIITYAGTLTTVGNILELAPAIGSMDYPATHKNAYMWTQDKNTSWLESFFSGVAN